MGGADEKCHSQVDNQGGSVQRAESATTSSQNQGLFAQVAVSHPDFALRSGGQAAADPTVTVVDFTGRADGTAIVFVEIECDDLSDFELTQTDTDSIIHWEALNTGESRRLCCVHLGGMEPILRRACADVGAHVSRMVSHKQGWLLDLQLPDREALTELTAQWDEAGINFELQRIAQTAFEEPRSPLADLTAEQYNLLQTAYQSAYFTTPRGVSQVDLAEELGVSTSGFSQRLRRALGTLLDGVFQDEDSMSEPLQNTGR